MDLSRLKSLHGQLDLLVSIYMVMIVCCVCLYHYRKCGDDSRCLSEVVSKVN